MHASRHDVHYARMPLERGKSDGAKRSPGAQCSNGNVPCASPLARLWFTPRQGLADAVEHRHGKQRVPLLSGGVGSSVCVNDINADELKGAIADVWAMHDDDTKLAV